MTKQYSTLPIPHRRILFFDLTKSKDGIGDEWLQITSVDNIGTLESDVRQKIIRIPEDKQLELYYMLKEKFEPKISHTHNLVLNPIHTI